MCQWVVVHATVHVPLDHMELVTHVSHSMSLMTDMAEHVRWTLRAQQPVLFCDLLCAKYIYYLSICVAVLWIRLYYWTCAAQPCTNSYCQSASVWHITACVT